MADATVSRNTSTIYYVGKFLFKIFRTLFMICMTFIILYPLLYIVSMAFRTPDDVFNVSVVWVPIHYSFNAFKVLFTDVNIRMGNALWNTSWISVLCSLLQVVITCITAYGFARFRFWGYRTLFALLIFSVVVPPQMYMTPLYFMLQNFSFFGLVELLNGGNTLSLISNPLVMVVMAAIGQGIRAGLFILIMRQFMKGLPADLEDAAMIDGCGFLKTFIRIILPNVRTAIVVVFLFSVVWYWNDYYVSRILLGVSNFTLSMSLANLRQLINPFLGGVGGYNPYDVVTYEQAACLVVIVPIMILFLVCQKYFVEGLERTGIVG